MGWIDVFGSLGLVVLCNMSRLKECSLFLAGEAMKDIWEGVTKSYLDKERGGEK